jgi:ferredoxin
LAYTIIETCIGCTACTKKCPVEAISGYRNELHVIDPEARVARVQGGENRNQAKEEDSKHLGNRWRIIKLQRCRARNGCNLCKQGLCLSNERPCAPVGQ